MFHTRTIGRGIERFSLTLTLVLTAVFSVRAQTATSQPPPNKNKGEPTAQISSKPSDQVAASHQTTTTAKPKKPKRGQLIIAPIPISSPAVGSGLVLAVGSPIVVRAQAASVGDYTSAKTNIRQLLRSLRGALILIFSASGASPDGNPSQFR